MLNLFIKGFLIGLGKIIPGVSGSVMAISFGIYDRIVNIISTFPKKINNNISFILPIMVGFVLSLTLFSNIFNALLDKYYVIMMFLFIGLIIGSVPNLIKEFKFSISNTIIFFISFLVIILISFINQNKIINIYSPISYIFIGVLEAFTSIVPGISGTAMMMMLGCYSAVLTMFSNFFYYSNLKYLIPFLIGVIIGSCLISKFIAYLLRKYRHKLFASIIGFIFSSTIILIFKTLPNISSITQIFFGIIMLLMGIKLSSLLS